MLQCAEPGCDTVTAMANVPAFIKGVVNLRGVIVPIIDMRIKFNLGRAVYDQLTVAITRAITGRMAGWSVWWLTAYRTLSS